MCLACCEQAGLVTALGKLMKRSGVNDTVMLATSEALKHLTASSQGNRNSLVASGTLPHVIQALSSGA